MVACPMLRGVALAHPVTFASLFTLYASLALVALAAAVVLLRRPALPLMTKVLAGMGLLVLSLAAGEMVWRRPAAREVAVMVDLSPSTRSAAYRDRAALERRVGELLGETPHRFYYFSDGMRREPTGRATFPDLPGERTTYESPVEAAVLLFSDGRFDPPAAPGPPTYPVLDPGLVDPADAAVESLEPRAGEAAVRVRNAGAPRALSLTGTRGGSPTTAPAGDYVVTRPLDPQATDVAAFLSPADRWPENDALAAMLPPPAAAERWIVGSTSPPAPGWRVLSPANLPTDPAAYLAPSVIVLSNVSAQDLSPLQQDRLRQYARDLGGGLVILGGPRAFAAGGYPGTALEALSPLASTPPRPTTHWMLLADASGSMGGPASPAGGGPTRWQYAADALVRVLQRLPPDDLVSIGSFAEGITWWSAGRSVGETKGLPLPPPDVRPRGPTNLRPALESIAAQAEPALPKQLLLLTDADAEIGDPASLAAALKAKNIRLHLLALGQGRGLGALREVVLATGGRVVQQENAAEWAAAVLEIAQAAGPRFLHDESLAVRFTGELAGLPGRSAAPWNRTWLKRDATPLAEATAEGETIQPVARWNVGEGAVLAGGFAADSAEVERFASLVARRPADPRCRVTWHTGPRLTVAIDAGDGQKYLNGQRFMLALSPDGSQTGDARPIPQTAPGRYELSLPAPRSPVIATLRGEGRVLDRIAVAGRYAPEFDAIGVDREALRALAERTGGRVIVADEAKPIEFHWPPRGVPLSPWLASAGALLVALGLVWWRIRT
jgi:Ca-activated chloride channel homolog